MSDFRLEKFEKNGTYISGDQQISYKSVCYDEPVHAEDGTLLGTMFVYTYLRTDIQHSANRPVLFAYNGGPGSSAMWLHAGLLGVKRVKMEDPLKPKTVPPFEIEDNPLCILDLCDIVMIDPPGTGFSQLVHAERQSEAFSLEADVKIIAEFIQHWTNEHQRWNSPKYLLGESYGTIRSCVLADALMGGPLQAGAVSIGIPIDGIIMLGALISVNPCPNLWDEYGTERMALDLPTMAAVNHYFMEEKSKENKEFVEEAFHFAESECISKLYKGNRMTKAEAESFAEKLAYYTGLPIELLAAHDYRIPLDTFAKNVLAPENLEVGMYDGRYTLSGNNRIGIADPVADDGAMGQYTPAFRGAFMEIAKKELGIELTRPFININFNVNGMWQYTCSKTPFQHLQSALRRNKDMRVLICNGLYDLVTTVGQARYTAAHLQYEKGQVIVKEYPSGHMPYVGKESESLLVEDLRAFIRKEELESCC